MSSSTESTETDNIKVKKKKRTFRCVSKRIALTYAQCPLTREVVANFIGQLHEVKKYVIAQEEHKDGGKHIHCYFEFVSKIDVKNVRHFDIDGHHPNIMTRHPLTSMPIDIGWARYCLKEDKNALTNMVVKAGGMDFSHSLNFRKRFDDEKSWEFTKKRLARKEWPEDMHIILRFDEEHQVVLNRSHQMKRRHTCIIADAGFGKTTTVKTAFKGYQVFFASKGNYPMEGYLQEPIIVFDCAYPRWNVLEALTDMNFDDEMLPGESGRNTGLWLLPDQQRLVIILSNDNPDYPGRMGPFNDRFVVYDWRDKKRRIKIEDKGLPRRVPLKGPLADPP